MSIELTRALIGAGALWMASFAGSGLAGMQVFKMLVPHSCSCASAELLDPRASWADKDAYDSSASELAEMFRENFKRCERGARSAGCWP